MYPNDYRLTGEDMYGKRVSPDPKEPAYPQRTIIPPKNQHTKSHNTFTLTQKKIFRYFCFFDIQTSASTVDNRSQSSRASKRPSTTVSLVKNLPAC